MKIIWNFNSREHVQQVELEPLRSFQAHLTLLSISILDMMSRLVSLGTISENIQESVSSGQLEIWLFRFHCSLRNL